MSLNLKYLGHASVKIKAEGKTVYIDPYEGEYEEKADLVLVTHSHSDHCDPEKISKIRRGDTVVVAPKDCVSKIGGKVRVIEPGSEVTVENVKIEAVHAYNFKRFRSPGIPFHPKHFGVSFIITIKGKRIYHAGDTDFIPEMKELKDIYLALLPSGGTYTMDNPEAVEATLAINPEIVIPMHRWDTDPTQFKMEVETKSKIKVIVPKKGEEITL